MSALFIARRALLRRPVARRSLTTTSRRSFDAAAEARSTAQQKAAVQEQSKLNPETYVRCAYILHLTSYISLSLSLSLKTPR